MLSEAKNLLLYQHKNAKKINALLCALVRPFLEAQKEINKLTDGKCIEKATGQGLDILAEIVGQKRNDLTDEDLKAWIKVRMLLNRCNGTHDELVQILVLFFSNKKGKNFHIKEYKGTAEIEFLKEPKFSLEQVKSITKSAMPVGVSLLLKKAFWPPVFRFDEAAFPSHFAEYF